MKKQPAPLPAMELIPVAHVVVDAGGRLAYANARAQEILGIGTDHIGQPIEVLGLGTGELELLVEHTQASKGAFMRAAVNQRARDGGSQTLDIIAIPLRDQADASLGTGIILLCLQVAANKELETANEELKAANEALEHLNAQLQSAYESLKERLAADLESRARK
jgi:PAS domain-containing protein